MNNSTIHQQLVWIWPFVGRIATNKRLSRISLPLAQRSLSTLPVCCNKQMPDVYIYVHWLLEMLIIFE